MDSVIPDIRRFNRFYTQQLGVLEEHMHESPFSLSEARVLYEIGISKETTAADLGRELGLDRAYLSRMLAGLTSRGFIVQTASPNDRRQTLLTLSDAGAAAVAQLNTASDAAVQQQISSLTEDERRSLASAMAEIRRLLGDEVRNGPAVLRPHRIGELGWLIHRQAVLYAEQFGWNGEFESLIARIYHEFEAAEASPPKALWVAEQNGRVVGSVFVTPHPKQRGTAQLRMLYVEPEARGQGLGAQLVAQAVDFGRRSGYGRMRLWTQSVLVSARRIYAAAGFTLVESSPHHSFGKDLMGEYWERDL